MKRGPSPAEIRRVVPKEDMLSDALKSEDAAQKWLLQNGFVRRPKSCSQCGCRRWYEYLDATTRFAHWRCKNCGLRQNFFNQSVFSGLRASSLTVVKLLKAYCKEPWTAAPNVSNLVQSVHVGKTQCMHAIQCLRDLEFRCGRHYVESTSLKGNVEVDGTSVGKFYVSARCRRFAKEIEALTLREQSAGRKKPQSFCVHLQVLGAFQRDGPALVSLSKPRPVSPPEFLEELCKVAKWSNSF
eukprot:s176_g30.t1